MNFTAFAAKFDELIERRGEISGAVIRDMDALTNGLKDAASSIVNAAIESHGSLHAIFDVERKIYRDCCGRLFASRRDQVNALGSAFGQRLRQAEEIDAEAARLASEARTLAWRIDAADAKRGGLAG